jgi:hypothetical protein
LLGPDHEYDVASAAEPVNVRFAPAQRLVELAFATNDEGYGFTVTTVVVAVVVPQELIADNV